MIGKRILKLAWTVHNCRGWFILERITEVASTGSVVSVDHKHRRPQAPSFWYVPAFGKRQKCGLPASVGFKEYEVLLRSEVRCSLPTFNRLVVSPAPPRPVGTFNHYELDEVLRFPLDTSGGKPAAGCFLWLFEFLLLDVVGGLHLYVYPSF
jgi:hypothetical protein